MPSPRQPIKPESYAAQAALWGARRAAWSPARRVAMEHSHRDHLHYSLLPLKCGWGNPLKLELLIAPICCPYLHKILILMHLTQISLYDASLHEDNIQTVTTLSMQPIKAVPRPSMVPALGSPQGTPATFPEPLHAEQWLSAERGSWLAGIPSTAWGQALCQTGTHTPGEASPVSVGISALPASSPGQVTPTWGCIWTTRFLFQDLGATEQPSLPCRGLRHLCPTSPPTSHPSGRQAASRGCGFILRRCFPATGTCTWALLGLHWNITRT